MVLQFNHYTRLAQKRCPICFAVFVIQRFNGHVNKLCSCTVERPFECASKDATKFTFTQKSSRLNALSGNEIVRNIAHQRFLGKWMCAVDR